VRHLMSIVKALADENRIRALLALRGGELCVCQIIELLGLAPSTVSKHMSILKQAGLVEATKRGRWVYYRIPGEDEALDHALDFISLVRKSLSNDPVIRRDDLCLHTVLEIHPLDLCKARDRKSEHLVTRRDMRLNCPADHHTQRDDEVSP